MDSQGDIESEKGGEGSEIAFNILPPRVIIFDILCFHKHIVDAKSKPFELFGYFKASTTRNYWYLFTCLEMGDGFSGAMSIEHLRYLRIDTCSPFLRDVVQHSSFLKSLRYFEISPEVTRTRDNSRINPKFVEKYENVIFSHRKCYPNLEILKVKLMHSKGENWDSYDLQIWKSLTELTLMGRNFRNSKILSALRSIIALNLMGIKLEERTNTALPHIQNLSLCNCSNILIHHGSKLTDLVLIGIRDEEMIEVLYKNSPLLKCLQLQDCGVHTDDPQFLWLLDRQVNPLPELRNLNLFMVHGFEGTRPFCSFGPKCEEIKIVNCHHLKEGPLFLDNNNNNNYKRSVITTTLELLSLKFLTCLHEWVDFTKFLKVLVLNDLSSMNMDHFFQINNFENLTTLSVSNIPLFSGTRRQSYFGISFPSLEELNLASLPELEDVFFQNEREFSNLVVLKIYFCPKIKGDLPWIVLPKLENFDHLGCGFSDVFWENLPFSEECLSKK